MRKTLIFDFDGTLIDSFGLAFKCINQLSEKYHYNTFDNPDFWRGKPLKDILTQDVNLNLISTLFFIRDMRKLMRQHYDTLSFFEDLIPVLRELNKDYDIGIATTNSYNSVQLMLNKYKIDFFKFIYADISVFGKPQKLKYIIKKHHLSLENTVYIGDEQRDIEAAFKAQLQSIAVTWGFNTRELLLTSNPTYIVDTPQELYDVIYKNISSSYTIY
jgi:phosphoglycolate phosphatase-like HAD superfamily hydrolase